MRGFLAYLQVEKGLAPNSLAAYARDLTKLDEWARSQQLHIGELSRADLRRWIAALSKAGLRPASIARAASTVRGFYQFLFLDGHTREQPADQLTTPRVGRTLPNVLTLEQVDQLFAGPDVTTPEGIRDRAILELLYATGLRVSELVTLTLEDVSLVGRSLICRGKRDKQRQVLMGQSAVYWLRTYVGVKASLSAPLLGRKQRRLFEQRDRPMSRHQVWTLVTRYARQAGLRRVTPHTLRHSFATHLLLHGTSTRHVQALLGHSDISSTELYTHLTTAQLQRRYDQFHPRTRQTEQKANRNSSQENARQKKVLD